jgi:hypothetical protein
MKRIALCLLFCATAFGAFAQLKEMVGIGVRLQIDSSKGYKLPVVVETVPNSPARDGGLQAGDYIITVEGKTTRNVVLKDVIAMLLGDEDTQVRIAIERNGSSRNYTLMRKNIKYATSHYSSAVKDDDFCTALVAFMNDAPYDFAHTIDTLHYTDENKAFGARHYDCKTKIPGAEKVSIRSSFGYIGVISFGSFKTKEEVNVAGTPFMNKLKTCFPEYYFEPEVDDKGNISVQIGKSTSAGFEAPILTFSSYFDNEAQVYKLNLNVNGGKRSNYYKVTEPALDNEFTVPVRSIYSDIMNNYSRVKGTKHTEKSTGLFSSGSTWYDIVPLPDGAQSCTLQEGGLGMGNGCRCTFFLAEDRTGAKDAYVKLVERMRNQLGPDFVYTLEKEELDMTIPSDAISVATFGIKKKKDYESGPLISVVLQKYSDGRYTVNMLFHKFGF